MNQRRLTPSMSLLTSFEASARHLSFTRAADELSLTQSAVSRQVQVLEATLGVALFHREGRNLNLTEAGGIYLRELNGSLQRIRNATLRVLAYRAGGGSLHLAVLPIFASKWLMPRLSQFYAAHPNILVHIHTRLGQFDLEKSGLDAAIGIGDGGWPHLEAYHLSDEQLLPVISPQLAQAQPIREPADIAQHRLLHVAARPSLWSRWFKAQNIAESAMRAGPQFELTAHLIQAVASGIGVGLLPSFLIKDELRDGTLAIAIDRPMSSDVGYYLFVPPQGTRHAPLALFKDWLLSAGAEPVWQETSGAA